MAGCLIIITLCSISLAQSTENILQDSPPDIKQLRDILQDAKAGEKNWTKAATFLANEGTDAAKNALLTSFAQAPDGAKPAIIRALGNYPDEDVAQFFTSLIIADIDVKDTLTAFRKVDGHLGWSHYLELAQSGDLGVDLKRRLLFDLAENKVHEAIPLLEKLTGSVDKEVRAAAILSLGELGSEKVAPLLFELAANSEYNRDERGYAVNLLPKVAGDQTEVYLMELVGLDNAVDKPARWTLSKYRNENVVKKELKVKNLRAEENKDGSFVLKWGHVDPSVGYLIEVKDINNIVGKCFAAPGKNVELELPPGAFSCFVHCIMPDEKYLAYFKGGIARLCESSSSIKINVQESNNYQVTLIGEPSESLEGILKKPDDFIDKVIFITGIAGSYSTEISPVTKVTTRQDWVLAQGNYGVFITDSPPWNKYYSPEKGQSVGLIIELKRSAEGGYGFVSIVDWPID